MCYGISSYVILYIIYMSIKCNLIAGLTVIFYIYYVLDLLLDIVPLSLTYLIYFSLS